MKKGMRLILSLMLAAALLCGMAVCLAEEAPAWTEGSVVTYGEFPQTEAGTDDTPIEWIVLEVDGENHRALLLSKYGLDMQQYNTRETNVTWETCSLRAWLNNDFWNKAFTLEEQSAILLTDVDNSGAQGYSGWTLSGGNNTQDHIFLLSYAEANRYLNVPDGDAGSIASRVAPTAYAVNQGTWTSTSEKTEDDSLTAWWWLRSPGRILFSAAIVDYDGTLDMKVYDRYSGTVRPAMWISLE